ncbi:MAG: ferritin family protein [Candidatus Thorarchaeota archaeon]|nr:ferritin family protein [Candidatus Thorarchaeota archaeon]
MLIGRGQVVLSGMPLTTVQESFEKLISLAIEREEEAYEFYTEAAKKAELTSSAKLLKELAKQEVKHKEKLMKALKGDVCDTFGCTMEELERRDLNKYLLDIPLAPSATPQELLIIAMKREEASFNFYKSLSELTGNASHRGVFETLAKEENQHKDRLQELYDKHFQPWM